MSTEGQRTCGHWLKGGGPSKKCAEPRRPQMPSTNVRTHSPDASRVSTWKKTSPETIKCWNCIYLVFTVFADHVTRQPSMERMLRFPVIGRGVRWPWNTEHVLSYHLWHQPQNSPSFLVFGSNSVFRKKCSWKVNWNSFPYWLPSKRQPIPFTGEFMQVLKCGFCIMGTATLKKGICTIC